MAGEVRFVLVVLSFLLFLSLHLSAADSAAPTGPPKAKVEPVTDDYFGTKVVDNYRWLENGDSPESQEYARQQLAYTRSILDPLPSRDAIHQRLSELLNIGTVNAPQIGGEYYFYTKRDGGQNQPVLYVRKGVHGEDRILVDPNTLAADGTVALDWWYSTDDGKYVTYGTSHSGDEISTLRILETATGKLLPDTIERARAASVAWRPDHSGFFYTKYPNRGDVAEGQENYNRHVFYHKLGDDVSKDKLIFGAGRDPQDWPNVDISEDGRWLSIAVEQGWTKSELFVASVADALQGTSPVKVTDGKNFLYSGSVYKGQLYITTNEDAPRYRVFRVDAANPARANWKELIPQTEAVLQGIAFAGGKIFAQYEHDASSELKILSLDGKPERNIPLPTIGTVFSSGSKYDSHEIFYAFHSFTVPPTVYRYDVDTNKSEVWAQVKADVNSSDYEVKQVFYPSKDGTKIPMFIVHKKGLKLDGTNPTLLTGYGGFNISETPAFSRGTYLWMEHGGVYALANLRGGAEYGEDWHRAGMLGNKQNVFDDFIAAGEYLVREKYTSPAHLAIQGGSNGGLLMGAALTQRPDLFKAVICAVPLLDMLRFQNFLIAKLWVPEYGSSEHKEQFDWIYKYSPYQHVKPGAEYPAIMFMTADSDTRVSPIHAKKMAALMQAQAANGASKERPILLRIEPKAGHGAGKPVAKQIEEGTDVWSFLFWQLGVK